MKNISQLLLIWLLLFVGQKAQGQSVTRKVHFTQTELKCSTITADDGLTYSLLSYPGTENDYYNPGYPTLPIKYVTIPLPYTADDISLSVKCFNTTSNAISKRIYPIQEPEVTFIEYTKKGFTPCVRSIYEFVAPYPSEQARIAEISCVGYGDRLVVVAVYPITYIPVENRYEFSEDVELTLTYNHSSNRAETLTRSTRTIDIGIPFYEYCVITSQNLKDAFTRLIAWKREKGLNAGVVCKETILSNNYCSVGDTVSSINDDAGKIRQYLQYAYASGVTKYVLFGGNDSVLPIRYGTGRDNFWTDSTNNPIIPYDYKIPSDFYFSELNSNWKKDSDIYYGEYSDNLDYGAELYVGRILCTNSVEIQNYTDKLLRYEMNPGNGDFSYLKKALYTQSDEMQRDHEQEIIAAQLQSVFPIDTIFSEMPTYNDSSPNAPYGNNVIAEMNGHYGYVSWGGHGHPNEITVKSNGCADSYHYAITSVQGNIPYVEQETANGLDNLTNKDYPMLAYSISCTITPFDVFNEYTEFPNIGQSFTLGKDYGGPVLVGNTRYGWVGLSASMQKKFNEGMTIDPIVGYAQNYAKLNYHTYYYHGHYLRLSSNIIGCPNIRVWTDIPKLFSATMSYNSNNYVITANNSITNSEIGVRDIMQTNEVIDNISFNPSQGSKTLSNVQNCLITLTGINCLPQILPLTIQNTSLHGSHHAIVKDVSCGKNVRSGTQGDVTFEQDADYTFETKGTFELTEGVEIKQGAQLEVITSEINY